MPIKAAKYVHKSLLCNSWPVLWRNGLQSALIGFWMPSKANIGYHRSMKVVAKNRRASFDYEISDTLEAGIMLTGQEVKSCRLGHVDLAGSYLSFQGGKPVIKQMKITPYKFASGLYAYDPGRDRPLLLSKAQAASLEARMAEKGITVIPYEVRAGKFIKLALAVGRGRKTIDKRRKIKEREMGRNLREGREI
jgi:SsrA-binding protein